MADRTFAADGDPPHADPGGRRAPFDTDTRRVVDDADANAGVARRLQSRLDRQLWLLERLQGDPLQTEPAELPELLDLARRMRRDSESLLLLAGRDPGVRDAAPQELEALLLAAATAAEEPRRVEVAPAPHAAVVTGAATELLHVLAELLDHATAVYPGATVRVAPHVDSAGALTVDVYAHGATRHDPDGLGGQRALDAAERLARRSRHGIALLRALGDGELVASITCPRAAVLVQEPSRPVPAARNGSNGHSGRNGSDLGHLPIEDLPAHPLPVPAPSGPAAELNMVPTPESGFDAVSLPPLEPAFAAASEFARNGSTNGSNGNGAHPTPKLDARFGSIADIPINPDDVMTSTPIFEAIASAWFVDDSGGRSGGAGAPSLEWETPGDREWRAAAEKALHEEPTKLTARGLPMRRPGGQLVPPPRTRSDVGTARSTEKIAPEHVRDRLGGYQRGVERGRHRAEPGSGTEPGDPEFW
ncbi:hypothetical protein ACQEVB_25415 [Pseudonocardia sp. CA-107938]|uniref:hypothetical protein n=1 Tax=Pseudonocardia sp. CA-107938 TaxID=3240021 RepID=UPI003D935ED6